jgi:3-oxoacyl-ACP reductase-like protein
MNEPLKRRSLLAVPPQPPALPDEAIAAVAARNGFANAVPSIASASFAPPVDQSALRRQRTPTGRDHQFNVRLRLDTRDFIYAQANERNIPIAQVIEEALDALKRQQQRS